MKSAYKKTFLLFAFLLVVGFLIYLYSLAQNSENQAAAQKWPVIQPGLRVAPLASLHYPQTMMEDFRRQIDRLKKTGSMSGGELTHEFSYVSALKKSLAEKGLKEIKASLAILPTDLGRILGSSFTLIGADSQSKYIESKGWTGFFQVFKSNNDLKMIELSENQMETRAGDGGEAPQELVNFYITGGYAATYEYIKNPEGGYVYNLNWFAKEREFQLTTKFMSQQEAVAIAEAVTALFNAMPNDGWAYPELVNKNIQQKYSRTILSFTNTTSYRLNSRNADI